jgi:hypothetical protein
VTPVTGKLCPATHRDTLSFKVAVFVLGIAAQSFAVTYIVPPDRFEIERASAIVIGRVLGGHAERSPFGIETVTTIALEEAIKGNPGNVIQIHEPGGIVDGEMRLVPGVPVFADGDRLLLLLYQRDDGSYTVSDMQLGSFHFVRDLLVRDESEIEGWDAHGKPHQEPQRSADRFVDYVRGIVRGEVMAEDYVVSKMAMKVSAAAQQPVAAAAFTATSYMLTYGAGFGTRWNVFPGAVTWNQGNSETGVLGSGTAEINAAFAIWNAGGTHYVLGGASPNPNGFLDPTDFTNNFVFEKNLTSAGLQAFSCSSGGALGISGMTRSNFGAGAHVFHGETFGTTLEADVSMNQGLGACNLSQVPHEMFQSVIVHELGHTLGFRHSDQNRALTASCVGDPTLDCTSNAIMNHILVSGLNGQLQAWDNAALSTVYGSGPACAPPSIAQQPAGSAITAGNSAQLSVSASGTGPFSYQWFIGSSGDVSTPVNGGTVATIAVSPANTTSYWARVTGQCAPAANSNAATVTVSCPSVIAGPPQANVVSGGFQLVVNASGGSAFTYAWFDGSGAPAGSGNPLLVNPQATTSYWCRITNNCGKSADSVAVQVTIAPCIPPQITSTLKDQTVIAGTPVSLTIDFTGQGVIVSWFQGASGTPIGAGQTFVTPPLTQTTQFHAHVANACGVADSNIATITVTPPRRRTVRH